MFRLFHRHNAASAGSRALRHTPFVAIMFALAALLTFTGCGLPGNTSATKPSGTPTAQDILAKAKSAHLTDETFTVTLKGTSGGKPFNATGTGKGTEKPPRADMSLNTEVNGTNITLEELNDGTTNATYTRITAPAQLASKTWQKQTDSSGGSSGSDMLVGSVYSLLSDTKLVGSEQVNGVATWHLKGTVKSTDNSDETIEIFVRQSDYLPAEMIVHTGGTDPVDATLIYTALNSGVSIDLPSA